HDAVAGEPVGPFVNEAVVADAQAVAEDRARPRKLVGRALDLEDRVQIGVAHRAQARAVRADDGGAHAPASTMRRARHRSSHARRLSAGLRSRSAGWNVTTSGGPRSGWRWPRRRASGTSVLSRLWAAWRPSATISRGRSSAIWRTRYGSHAATSCGCGSRLPGGRDLSTLAMYTSARLRPSASIIALSSCPARPTNGSP